LTLSHQLTSLLEAGIQFLPPELLPAYAIDGQAPRLVAQPATRQEAAQVLQWASAQGLAVCPWGGGTQMALGNPPRRVDLALDLTRLDRLLDFQPADLTVTVEAGMTLAVLQSTLAQGGKFLPVEAPLAGRATVGGVLATGASGPLRFAYGLPRDWLIGIGVVGTQGVYSKAGGQVVKNVTGYDLNKLYTGSLGTLGVVVEATFKLAPRPADFAALVVAFPSPPLAVQAGLRLAAQVFAPQGLQVVTGPAASRLDLGGGATSPLAVAFFAGRSRAVRRRLEESRRFLQEQGGADPVALDGPAGQELLLRLTDLGWDPNAMPWLGLKASVPPSAVGQVVGCFTQQAAGGDAGLVADPAFGTVRLLQWGEIPSNPPFDYAQGMPLLKGGIEDLAAGIAGLRAQVRGLGGSVVVEQCPLELKQQLDVWDVDPQALAVMRRLKEKFDPLGALNPGRFAGRL
jgi:glycolate oxidase FAD binding subunit